MPFYRRYGTELALIVLALAFVPVPWLTEWAFSGDSDAVARHDAQAKSVRSGCAVRSVHDGDTLRADCGDEHFTVRLRCIDAPELTQRPWGQESRDYLRALIGADRIVDLHLVGRDRYGREIGEVLMDGRNLNVVLVEAGQAVVYRRYCDEPAYNTAEQSARARGLGVWSSPGDHQQPWEYRAARRGGNS